MADMSKANIALEALEKMGVKALSGTVDTSLSGDLEACYEELYAELEADGLVEWASTANVPERYVGTVSDIMAVYRAAKYGIPDERFRAIASRVGVDGEKGKVKIRRLMRPENVDTTARGMYF